MNNKRIYVSPYEFGHIWGEYIFNEISKITLANTNQISAVAPFRGNGAIFSQTTASQRPIFTPNVLNNKSGAVFTKTSNMLLSAGNASCWSNKGMTVFIVAKLTAQTLQMLLAKHSSTSNGSFYIGRATSGSTTEIRFACMNSSGTRVDNSLTNFPNNVFKILVVKFDGNSASLYPNLLSKQSSNLTGVIRSSSNSLLIGNYTPGGYALNGTICHILIYDESLSDASIKLIGDRYIAPYWNLYL